MMQKDLENVTCKEVQEYILRHPGGFSSLLFETFVFPL